MAKAKRKQKLRVFRTPIGFHDAYVAAPSQKAALEAWGADSNLFAQGAAEQVTDPELMKMPLEHPGELVKVLRGNGAEHLAAIDMQKPRRRSSKPGAEIVRKPRLPRPSRKGVERAEKALEALEQRQEKELAAVERRIADLERKRRELLRRHERDRDEARQAIEDERAEYDRAVRRHDSG